MPRWDGMCSGGCGAAVSRGERCRCSPAERARRIRALERGLSNVPASKTTRRKKKSGEKEFGRISNEEIIQLFNGGMTISGLSDMVKSRNGFFTKAEARALVEKVVYEDVMAHVGGAK